MYHRASCGCSQELLHSTVMTRRKRLILFWLCAVFFFITVVPLLLYSFGYRFSFESWRILRAGGLFITSAPSTGTQIFIDGKLMKETTLLSRKLFLQGLTPQTYHIEIKKNGYFTWEKSLPVRPELVTDVQALLIQDGPEGKVLSKGAFASLQYIDESNAVLALTGIKNETLFYSIERKTIIPRPATIASSTVELSESARRVIEEKQPVGFEYDPVTEKIVWWNSSDIWVRWLRGEEYLPLYTEHNEMHLFHSSYPIRNVSFYPGKDVVIVAYSNVIQTIELDGRDKHNSYPLYKGKGPEYIISGDGETMYILDDEALITVPLS